MLDLKSAKNLTDFALYSRQDVALWDYHVEDPAFMQLLKMKWRTYHVQYHPDEEYLILGTALTKEIGNELNRYVTLVDAALNQFEVVVDKHEGKLCFTNGLEELNKAYKLEQGAWMCLIHALPQLFVIRVCDRHDYEINYPRFDPPLSLRLDHAIYGPDASPGSIQIDVPMPYRHGWNCFKFSVTKWLTSADVTSDYLTFSYAKVFDRYVHKDCKDIRVVDDTGHYWLFKVEILFEKDEIKFGGDWKKFRVTRKLYEWKGIRLGAKGVGHNVLLYCTFDF